MTKRTSILLGLLLLTWPAGNVCLAAEAPEQELFPFVMPWDDATATATDLSGWNHKPAGKFGSITTGPDSHFYAGKERIRFLGVNIASAACFPEHETAEKAARRMAKLGVNLVRFHHMDASWNENIFGDSNNTRALSPDALDRFDYFFAQLKANGIYADINLLCSRQFVFTDGLPTAINAIPWKEQQTPAMFNEKLIRLQKEYARKLLNHKNPYTGLAYTKDPAVAFVEITNEHGLVHAWLQGGMDRMPEVYADELRAPWNAFLKKKYGTQTKLASRWRVNEPLGVEMLVNGEFRNGNNDPWVLGAYEGAQAQTTCANTGPEGLPALLVQVLQPGVQAWHIQLTQKEVNLEAGRPYTLAFWARSQQATRMKVNVMQGHEPWSNLGLEKTVELAPEWQKYEFVLAAADNDANGRVGFEDMMDAGAVYEIAGVSLKPGGRIEISEEETLKQGNFAIPKLTGGEQRSRSARQDWTTFLWERERAYWRDMYRYLKNAMHVRALVFGTMLGTSTPNIQAEMDVIDTHTYWHDPQFEGEIFFSPWRYLNTSLVEAGDGGTMGILGVRRVLGKPFMVSEYNHAFPNGFDSEAPLFLAAYAGLQDWDGIMLFAYDNGECKWQEDKVEGFMDIAHHPGKLSGLLPAACMFRRGDVSPAKREIAVPVDQATEIRLLPSARAWTLVDASVAGLNQIAVLMHRVGMRLKGKAAEAPGNLAVKSERPGVYPSDTGELLWDTRQKYLQVNTPKCKALVGYVMGREFNLDGVVVRPVKSLQSWAALTLSALDGNSPAASGRRLLLTACGLFMNTNMRWKYPPDTPAPFPPPANKALSTYQSQGEAPTQTEGIECEWVLPYAANQVKVYALDGTGARTREVPVTDEKGRAAFRISRAYRTIWYEINVSGN